MSFGVLGKNDSLEEALLAIKSRAFRDLQLSIPGVQVAKGQTRLLFRLPSRLSRLFEFVKRISHTVHVVMLALALVALGNF